MGKREQSRGGIPAVAGVCLLLAGCEVFGLGSGTARGASMSGDAGAGDAGPVADAPGDGADGAPIVLGNDAGLDAGPGDCEGCEAIDACHAGVCVDNACVQVAVEDGVPCTAEEDFVCVEGACVVRGCGDGWREPGPEPAREGCDDGNTEGGDACDEECRPAPLVIASRSGGRDVTVPAVPAVAADGSGALLFVWAAETGGSDAAIEIQARRASKHGVMVDAIEMPLVLAGEMAVGWPIEPAVAGLAEGWIVVWSDPADEGRARYLRVEPDGTVWPPRAVWDEGALPQGQARIASVEGGAVIAFTEDGRAFGGRARILARRFDDRGRAREGVLPVSGIGGDAVSPSLAASGSRWLAAWTELGASEPVETVRARRFDGAVAADADGFALAVERGRDPVVAAIASGAWMAAWTTVATDAAGDVAMRGIHAAGDPLEGMSIDPVAAAPGEDEAHPAIGEIGGGVVVAWHGAPGGIGVDVVSAGSDPPSAALEGWIAPPSPAAGVSIAGSSCGAWFVWNVRGGLGEPTAQRSVLAYLLPPE